MSWLDYAREKPEFIARLRAIALEQEQFRLDSKLRALVELRVSQINGCIYCVNLHSREARRMHGGEPLFRTNNKLFHG